MRESRVGAIRENEGHDDAIRADEQHDDAGLVWDEGGVRRLSSAFLQSWPLNYAHLSVNVPLNLNENEYPLQILWE